MYTQKKMINEAVRICKKHCPRLLSDVIDAYGTLSSGTQTIEDLIDAARVYEETGNFSKAVDTYLNVNDQVTDDADQLEEIWNQAIELSSWLFGWREGGGFRSEAGMQAELFRWPVLGSIDTNLCK